MRSQQWASAPTFRDPVCGRQVHEHDAGARVTFGGRSYTFCSGSCAETFRQTPNRYG